MSRTVPENRSSVPNPREHLIPLAFDFIESAMKLDGVERIAFVGSICTEKRYPKDIDLLVTISPTIDMSKLATFGRRLKGKGQGIGSGADIFLADTSGRYLGRICPKRDCGIRYPSSCDAQNCGKIPHLNDDLRVVDLERKLIADPPMIVHPNISFKEDLPEDLMNELKARFGKQNPQ